MPKEKKTKTPKPSTNKEENAEKPKKISQIQFEEKVIELAKSGLTSEKIGEALRQQKIHPKEHNKKISKILQEKGLYINPDLKNVEAKLKKIEAHANKNKKDKRAMREKERVFSQVKRTKEYINSN